MNRIPVWLLPLTLLMLLVVLTYPPWGSLFLCDGSSQSLSLVTAVMMTGPEDLEPGQVAPLPLPCVQIRECSWRNTAPALTLLCSSCQFQHYCQCFLCSFQEPHHGCHLECAMCLPSKQLGDGNREIRTLKSVSTTIGSLRSVHLHDTYLKTKVKKQKQINQN